MTRLLFALCAVASAMAMTPQELESFLYSPTGLDMTKQEAQIVAQKEAPILTQSMVTIEDLKNLMNMLGSPMVLGMGKADLRTQLLPLAEQHLDPTELKTMYDALYSVNSLDLDTSTARKRAIPMVKSDADPTQLKDLFNTLRGYKMSLSKASAQAKALELGAAGCDPVALEKSYAASKDLSAASDSATRANLNGEMRRYAKDGKAYTVSEMQSYYGAGWLTEWLAAPLEKRVAENGNEYTAREFKAYYTSVWENKWHAARTSTQMRLGNGTPYTMSEFVDYYKDAWQQQWSEAPVLPCKECKSSVGMTSLGCATDKDCPGSYCMNDPTKTPPYSCHAAAVVV